jgi:hypothetical protein
LLILSRAICIDKALSVIVSRFLPILITVAYINTRTGYDDSNTIGSVGSITDRAICLDSVKAGLDINHNLQRRLTKYLLDDFELARIIRKYNHLPA